MATLSDRRHTVRFPLPDLIVKGRDHTIKAPVYLGGSIVRPDSATVSVYNAANEAVVDAQAASIASDDVAEYTIGSASTTSRQVELGWRVEWVITLAAAVAPDGIILARNDAALVLHPWTPTITDTDLGRRLPAIDPSHATRVHTDTTLQDFIDEASTEIQLRLIDQGNRPNLILTPSALRQVHMYLAIALVLEDLAIGAPDTYGLAAARYRESYRMAWSELRFLYDADDDGQADDGDEVRQAAQKTIWLA